MKSRFDPVIRSGWVVLALCFCVLIALVCLAAFSENDRWLESFWWLIIGVPVFIFDGIFLMALYSARDRYEKGRAAQQAGDYFVHWTYMQQEWERFLKDDWMKTRKRLFVVSVAVIVLFMIIMTAAGVIKSEGHFFYALLGAVGFLSIIVYFVLHFSYVVYQERLAGPREVIIGKTGISMGGIYTAWDTVGSRLIDVKMIKGNYAILQFVTGVRGRAGSSMSFNVPVPAGREYEAEEVQRKLNEPDVSR